MSSVPKYADVDVVGEAHQTLLQNTDGAYENARISFEEEQRLRYAQRLASEQADVKSASHELAQAMRQLRALSKADAIPVFLDDLQAFLDRCTNADLGDLSATRDARKNLDAIERDLAKERRRFESEKLCKDLEGVAKQLAKIGADVAQMDYRESERFDPGQLDDIKRSIATIQKELASRRLGRCESGIVLLRKQLDEHLLRVRSGREEYDRNRLVAQQGIAAITDRCESLAAASELSHYLIADMEGMKTDLEALSSLLRGEQFVIVQKEVQRLDARVDGLVAKAKEKIAQAQKQKLVAEKLISAVISARGILLAGYPQHEKGKPAVVRFHVAGRGTLHVEISDEGPIMVRADGFKHEQSCSPQGQLEKTCGDFVVWFEEIRNAAKAQGLDIGSLHWDGEPTPERAISLQNKKKTYVNSTTRLRHGGTLR